MEQEIIEKHNENKNIINVLQSIQEKFGYIPKNETASIAKALNLPLSKMWGVATFYSQFKFEKRGKFIIEECNGTACHVNGSGDLIETLQEILEVEPGHTTSDSLFTLELVNCIGACARAPAVMINGKVYGNLDNKELKKIINDYKTRA